MADLLFAVQGFLPAYGTKPWEEVFAAQLSKLPTGPAGIFDLVKTEGECPRRLVDLWHQFMRRRIDGLEFMEALKAMRDSAASVQLLQP